MKNINHNHSKNKKAFTLLELVFVIAIIGLLSTLGVRFMVEAYKSYLFSAINNRLQNESATAIEFIAKRLSYRIKDSVIARDLTTGTNTNNFVPVQSAIGANFTVLAWVGSDIDGWRGINNPLWSGIIDLDIDPINQNLRLVSPNTNTVTMNQFITNLSYGTGGINNSALYFIGLSDSNVLTDYGWGRNAAFIQDQNGSMHPINNAVNQTVFLPLPLNQDFTNIDVFEYYKHAWTAYAIVHTANGDLFLNYNYQPWNGHSFNNAPNIRSQLIMQNVATFQYRAIGSLLKIQICVENQLTGQEYAICKEKTIY